MSNKVKNRFIIVDGLDGAGKTTIIHYLNEKLLNANVPVSRGRGLGTMPTAEAIRKSMLAEQRSTNYEIYGALMCLIDVYECFVLNKLKATEDVVLLDRYLSSYYAYQVKRKNSEIAETMLIDSFGGEETIHPDLYIYCDVSLKNSRERMYGRSGNNYLDEVDTDVKKLIRDGYEEFNDNYFALFPHANTVILKLDCNRTLLEIFNDLDIIIKEYILKDIK